MQTGLAIGTCRAGSFGYDNSTKKLNAGFRPGVLSDVSKVCIREGRLVIRMTASGQTQFFELRVGAPASPQQPNVHLEALFRFAPADFFVLAPNGPPW